MNPKNQIQTAPVAKRLFAYFQPEAEINKRIVTIDGGKEFDVTGQILRKDADCIGALRDNQYPSDELAMVAGLTANHDGPYCVLIEENLCAFFGVEHPSEITGEILAAKIAEFDDQTDNPLCDSVRTFASIEELPLSVIDDAERRETIRAIDAREVVGMHSSYGLHVMTDGINPDNTPALYALSHNARTNGHDWLVLLS